MWCTINAAIKAKRPCQLVTKLPSPCQKRKIIFKENTDKRPAACVARRSESEGRGGGPCARHRAAAAKGLRGPFTPRASSF